MEGGGRRTAVRSPHVVMLSSPGLGHLIPLTELATRLAIHHGLSVTLVATTDCSSNSFYKSFIASLPPGVASVVLPPVVLPDDLDVEVAISLTILKSLPALRQILSGLQRTASLVAFVADLFGTDTFDVAREFGVPPFIFFPSNLFLLSLSFHLPTLHETMPRLPDPITVPGCLPIHWKDLPSVVMDRRSKGFLSLLHHLKRYDKADGILVNSFQEMEPEAAMVLKGKETCRPPVHLVGPLLRNGRSASLTPDESRCLKWLDEQPDASVLYISLGSIGVLSGDQIKEMALGLEMSGHRFLWVVRSPEEKGVAGGSSDDPESFLPEGFLGRTKESGLVVPSWAPQVQVLGHRAVGGFLTHCGWSSTLESVVHGVPMIAWPLYAEQRMNALILVEGLKVALRAKEGEDGVVRREEISAAVEELIEGEEGRAASHRVRKLREAALKAMAEEGASLNALVEVVAKWKD